MNNCRSCGQQLETEARFCPSCGGQAAAATSGSLPEPTRQAPDDSITSAQLPIAGEAQRAHGNAELEGRRTVVTGARILRENNEMNLAIGPTGLLTDTAEQAQGAWLALLTGFRKLNAEVRALVQERSDALEQLDHRISFLRQAVSNHNPANVIQYPAGKLQKFLKKALKKAEAHASAQWPALVVDCVATRNANGGYSVAGTGNWLESWSGWSQKASGASRSFNSTLFRSGTEKRLREALLALYSINLALQHRVSELQNEREAIKQKYDGQIAELGRHLNDHLSQFGSSLTDAQSRLSVAGQPGWDARAWRMWQPPVQPVPINLGTLRNLSVAEDNTLGELSGTPAYQFPYAIDPRVAGAIHLPYASIERRSAVLGAARSLIARLLAAIPPGKVRFTFFDPLGLGENVSPFLKLGDYDSNFIDGKVWSSTQDLKSRLEDFAAHIEQVIQKYLRGDYETIEQYNLDAEEIAEPYRYLVILDFPSQFDDETMHLLSRIIENGPRCGVYTIIVSSTDRAGDVNYPNIEKLPRSLLLLPDGGEVHITTEAGGGGLSQHFEHVHTVAGGGSDDPPQDCIDLILDAVGRHGRGTGERTVDLRRALTLFEKTIRDQIVPLPTNTHAAILDDTDTWWRSSSREAVIAPVGLSGAKDVALLRFDSMGLSGGLMIGRPGSGKSTLLHTYIGGLTSLYSPEELELYLIDFKEGVEFKVYAEYGLPHARCVAIESEREFGLSILTSMAEEIKNRAKIVTNLGGRETSFENVRAVVDKPLPRVVLVFDEFHVLFARDDKISQLAAEALETVIRQGRAFGVHLMLASQSLSGIEILSKDLLNLLSVRVLLPSAEADATKLLADRNDAWKQLSRRGEGLLNDLAGMVEGNVPFQVAFESEAGRLARVQELRNLADSKSLNRRPVVFEGYASANIESTSPELFRELYSEVDPRTLLLRVAKPVTLDDRFDVLLKRDQGMNVMIVSPASTGAALGVFSMVCATCCALPQSPRVEFIDFTPIDEGTEDAFEPLVSAGVVKITRRRKSADLLHELATEVTRRVEEEDVRAPTILIILFGLQRARDFEVEAGFGKGDGIVQPVDDLTAILNDGPEFGVHVFAWADSLNSLSRRFPSQLLRQFAIRIAGPMSKDDSFSFIDTDAANGMKDTQLVVDIDGSTTRVMGYAVPSTDWLKSLVKVSTQQ